MRNKLAISVAMHYSLATMKLFNTAMTAITTRSLSYSFQGETLWLEAGTRVNTGVNYTYTLPDGTFLFVPSAYVAVIN